VFLERTVLSAEELDSWGFLEHMDLQAERLEDS
jgi:hypothetical protein